MLTHYTHPTPQKERLPAEGAVGAVERRSATAIPSRPHDDHDTLSMSLEPSCTVRDRYRRYTVHQTSRRQLRASLPCGPECADAQVREGEGRLDGTHAKRRPARAVAAAAASRARRQPDGSGSRTARPRSDRPLKQRARASAAASARTTRRPPWSRAATGSAAKACALTRHAQHAW